MCGRGEFNQKQEMRYSVFFEKEQILLGGAKGSGWNLNDPFGKRTPTKDYWFRYDGTTNCEVFETK